MATTIGRAGKQIFAAIDHSSRPGGGEGPPVVGSPTGVSSTMDSNSPTPSATIPGMFSPKPPSIQPPAHLLKKYANAYDSSSKATGVGIIPPSRRERHDSADSDDLEVALQECVSIGDDVHATTTTSGSLSIIPPRVVDSPTKPYAISPRLDKDMQLNPQSHGGFNEFQSGNTAVNSLMRPSNSTSASTTTNKFSQSSSTTQQPMSHQSDSDGSAEEFLQSLQKTLTNKRSFNKDELLAQLEALKQQNLLLTLHMERKDQETKEKLEQERLEREKAVMSLEQANQDLLQQLVDAKLLAEKKLAQEKLHFEDSMKRLEEDKRKLQDQIKEKQQQMQFESQIMKQLREEMSKRIHLLENDRQRMMEEMSSLSSHQQSTNGNESVNSLSQENHQRLLQLKQEIEQMDKEKSTLIQQLEENQLKAEQTNQTLLEQLSKDRELFQQQLQSMEREKRSLCDRLLAAENVAKLQHQVMNEEMEKQKRRSFRLEKKNSKGANSSENVDNSNSNNHNSSNKSLKKTVSFSIQPDLEIGFGVVQTPDDSEDDEDGKISKGKDNSKKEVVDISKMTLQEKLKFSAEQSKRRVQELTTKLKKRNKDRLRKNVKKMKETIEAEQLNGEGQGNGDSNHSSPEGKKSLQAESNGLKRSLPSTKSLFDLMSSNNGGGSNSRGMSRKQSMIHNSGKAVGGVGGQQEVFREEEEEDSYQILGNENILNPLDSITSLLSSPLTGNKDTMITGDKGKNNKTRSSSVSKKKPTPSSSSMISGSENSKKYEGIKSIMDDDSDEEGETKKKKESADNEENEENDDDESPIPMPELPPPHLSAAKGDIPRLIILNNMDTKLIVDAVDSVNRHPLFYAVAHGHYATTEFILSTIVQDKTLHSNTNNHFKDNIGNTVNPVHAAAMIFDSLSSHGSDYHQQQQDHHQIDRSQMNETIDKMIYHVIYTSAIYHTISHMDVYGDTVIHAAAAGGSEKILSLLLQTISDFIKTTIKTIYQEFMEKLQQQQQEQQGHNNGNAMAMISPSPVPVMKSFLDDDNTDCNNNNNTTSSSIPEYENTEKIYSTILTFLVNNQNSLGLTPSHLSTTSELLEVLHNHHANLLSTDFQQRSVLFIACAMNKDSCVEYLINSLDNLPEVLMSNCLLADDDEEGEGGGGDDFALTEQYTDNTEKVIMEQIMKRDYRGDTPLHAAACNNAVESLLILLQSGIDPRLMNDKQYTAYDLAVKNNHVKCIQILAEYTLHYCTSSEFDSVLFLKTLEGHKKIQEFIKDNPGYHMRNSTHNKGKKSQHAHNMSMFSLKNAKSMKLQRYGNWIAYYDADNPFAIFWYNHETTQSQWETPIEVMEWQERHHSSSDINIFDQTMQGKMSMKLRREGDWILYTAEEGKTFYYNEKTGDFQWTNPFQNEVEDHLRGYGHHQGHHHHYQDYQETQNDTYPMVNHHDLPDYVLASDWRPYLDENSGLVYWYNHTSKVSQWESPFEHQQHHHHYHQSHQSNEGNDGSNIMYRTASQEERSEKKKDEADNGYFDHLMHYQDQLLSARGGGGGSEQQQQIQQQMQQKTPRMTGHQETSEIAAGSQSSSPMRASTASAAYSSPRKGTTTAAEEQKGRHVGGSTTASPERSNANRSAKVPPPVVSTTKSERGDNVFSLDDDEDDDDAAADILATTGGGIGGSSSKHQDSRRSDMKEKLKQFSFKRKQQSMKRDMLNHEEEAVVQVDNEHDLDI